MEKIYCDKCGKEIKKTKYSITIYNDKLDIEIIRMDLCLKCEKEMIRRMAE